MLASGPAAYSPVFRESERYFVISLAGSKQVFAGPSKTIGLGIAVAFVLALIVGCNRDGRPATPEQISLAETHQADAADAAAAALQFRSEVVDGFLVVRIMDSRGQDGVAVRRTRMDGALPSGADVAARERLAAAPWLAAARRAAAIRSGDALQEHDGWIEIVELLQNGLRHDPTHLGMQRDLLTAEVQLLSFEAGSPLGPRVCEMTASAATQFEAAAGPLDPADRQLIAEAREHVLFSMKLYPPLSAASELTGDRSMWKTLGAPVDFVILDSFAVGPYAITEQRVVDPCPKDTVLRDELFFVISTENAGLPEKTTAFVLSRRGQGQESRYYLFFRSIRGEQLISVFGQESPDLPILRGIVESSVDAAATQFVAARPTSGGRP